MDSNLVELPKKLKSRDTMKEKKQEMNPSTSKKSVAERKLKLLAQTTKAIATTSQTPVENLSQTFQNMSMKNWQSFDKATRLIAEKQINDLLFDVELKIHGN